MQPQECEENLESDEQVPLDQGEDKDNVPSVLSVLDFEELLDNVTEIAAHENV